MRVALGDVCSFLNGGTPSRSVARYFEGDIPWITGADIVGPIADSARSYITKEAVKDSATNLVPAGTILLVTRTSVGKVAVAGMPLCFSQDITALTPDPEKIDTGYLVHLLRTKQPHFERLARGATIKGITREAIVDIQLALLPLPEQRRIAEILDKADALRAKRRAALAQLDTLTQSIFLDMFGDPATNPKGWPEKTIGDLCEVKGGKRLPKGEEYSSTPTPFRYIRVTDLKSGSIDESALVYLKPEIQAEISRYIVNTGDVVISIAGSIGLIAAVSASLDGANLTENAAKLVPRAKGVYDPIFLSTFLQTPSAQSQIGSHIGQVTIGKLALFRIEKIKLPLPPMEAQLKFARCVEAVQQYWNVHRASISGLDSLFASLQHRAFQGEL